MQGWFNIWKPFNVDYNINRDLEQKTNHIISIDKKAYDKVQLNSWLKHKHTQTQGKTGIERNFTNSKTTANFYI